MTLDEFLVKLSETPRSWHLQDGRFIRQQVRQVMRLGVSYLACDCPITAVGGYDVPNNNGCGWVKEAGDFLEIPLPDRVRIIDAADKSDGYNPILRAQLLAACGISEED